MGSAFDAMPSLVRHVHSPAPKVELEGRVDIDGAENWPGRVIAYLAGFAATARDLPRRRHHRAQRGAEVWTRRFGSASFSSRMRADGDGRLSECFGPISMTLEARQTARGFALAVKGWRLGPLPLPRFLMPATRAGAGMDDQGRYSFDVWIGMPLIGRLVHYRGWLSEPGTQPATVAAVTNNLVAMPLAKSAAQG